MASIFQRYLLPGLVFQSIVIAGGYATGRELVQFFLPAGPWGGILAMGVTMTVWGVVAAVSFELVRLTRSYDYKSFFTVLLGRYWLLYEVAFLTLLVLVLAVIGAAAGEIVSESAGLNPAFGTVALIGLIGVLVFFGSAAIEKALGVVAIFLYVVYVILIFWCLLVFGDVIKGNFRAEPIRPGWIINGLTYAGYNMAVIPAVFFCIRRLQSRRETLGAGLLSGPLAMLPGVLLYVAMMGAYPHIGERAVPINYLLGQLQAPWFQLIFQVVVFWALTATGTGLIHTLNERIATIYRERERRMPRMMRPVVALITLIMSVFVAGSLGLVTLIAHGYGLLTYAFLAILVVPVMTIGTWKIWRLSRHSVAPPVVRKV